MQAGFIQRFRDRCVATARKDFLRAGVISHNPRNQYARLKNVKLDESSTN